MSKKSNIWKIVGRDLPEIRYFRKFEGKTELRYVTIREIYLILIIPARIHINISREHF